MEERNLICPNSPTKLLDLYSQSSFPQFPIELSKSEQSTTLINYFLTDTFSISEYIPRIKPYFIFFIIAIIFLLLWITFSLLWIWKRKIQFPFVKFYFQIIIHIPIFVFGIVIIIFSCISINKTR